MAISANSIWVLCVFLCTIALIIRPLRVPIPRRLRCCSQQSVVVVVGFALAPIIAVLLLLATWALPFDTLKAGVVGDVLQPWAIVVLFFSLSVISVSLDVSGLLSFISLQLVVKAGRSRRRLFLAFFTLSSLLTIVTSNDIVIMVLTPIVVYACSSMRIDPRPMLFAEYFAANVWSSLLWNGNPTNIVVAVANNINFLDFSRYSALPTLGAGVVLLVVLLLVFWKRLRRPTSAANSDGDDELPIVLDVAGALKNRRSAIVGSLVLFACLVALAAGSFFNTPVYLLTLPFAVVVIIKDIVVDVVGCGGVVVVEAPDAGFRTARSESDDDDDTHASDDTITAATTTTTTMTVESHDACCWHRIQRCQTRLPTLFAVVQRQPWTLAPFVFCMFILVECLSFHGWTSLLADALASVVGDSVFAASFVVGLVSVLLCNLLNNQPATIFLTRVLDDAAFAARTSVDAHRVSLFALALASNYAANLTLIGALAGLMWQQILREKGVVPDVSYFEFLRYGTLVTIPVVLVAFLLLAVTS